MQTVRRAHPTPCRRVCLHRSATQTRFEHRTYWVVGPTAVTMPVDNIALCRAADPLFTFGSGKED
jgi:hypothetical protein